MVIEEKEHSLLSPSSSHRWLKCTPSARLEALEPPQPASEYAEEGTEAHTLAQIKLAYMLGKITVAEYNVQFHAFIMSSRYYNNEFNEYVMDYCVEVMNIIKLDYADQQVEVFIEREVKFEDIVPGGKGTSDVIIVGYDFIHIVDLKFGKGVAVSAIGNTQLRLYALGTLKTFRLKGIFTTARITIIQPRLNDKSTDVIAVIDLYDWAENYVKPRAELAYNGKGTLVAGEHCKFCKLKAKCQALADAQLEAARSQFELAVVETPTGPTILEPHEMSVELISKILTVGPQFKDWFKDVEAHARFLMLQKGIKIPGFKVVRGRSNRIITDEAAVVEILKANGYDDDKLYKPKEFVGITNLEKNVGKKQVDYLVGNYIIKPEGQPTVVPENDKREAIDDAEFRLTGQEFDIQIESED